MTCIYINLVINPVWSLDFVRWEMATCFGPRFWTTTTLSSLACMENLEFGDSPRRSTCGGSSPDQGMFGDQCIRQSGFCTNSEYLVALDSVTGKVLGQVRSNHEGMRVLSPSPDGRKLVGAGMGSSKFGTWSKGNWNPTLLHPSDAQSTPDSWLNSDQVLIDASIEPAFASLPTTMFDLIDLKKPGGGWSVSERFSFPIESHRYGDVDVRTR